MSVTLAQRIVASLPIGQRCPLCNQARCDVWRCANDHAPVLLSWQWADGVAGELEYEAWYSDPTAYHVTEQEDQGQLPLEQRYEECRIAARKRLELIRQLHPCGRMLDVGAGNGAFVDQAQEWCHSAEGIDPAPCGGVSNVQRGTWRHVTPEYDTITLFDVLEHLTRPQECLTHLKACLAKDGLVVVEMPEYMGTGDWQKHIRPKQHVCLYSRGAAEELFQRAGLTPILWYRPLNGSIGKCSWFLKRTEDI